jgi:hypothetical protein
MKTKLLLSFLLLPFAFCLSPCTAQVPQGFNYQAIARDGSGNILANQPLPVKIDIVDALTGGNILYEETFPTISSNQYGLITLVVGNGTPVTGTFSAIDWKSKTLFLKTLIQYPTGTWINMGTSQIWSVPYSLVAKDVTGPLTKLGITGTTSDMEEALFEVKNKAGNTVFAVYNEGIRAYVGNGNTKGAKGGFAVGGYDATKGSSTIYDLFTLNTDSARIYVDSKPHLKGVRGGFSVGGYDMTKSGIPVQNYLDVSKDSVRVYVDSNPATKGVRGGFSVGGYDMTKGGSVSNYLNIETNTTGIIDPAENRLLWYPLKNSFMTGKILIQKNDTVGVNSFASGYESKAIGNWSQALGFESIARGDYSTSIGKNCQTKGNNSFAFGNQSKAMGPDSYAFGTGAKATKQWSFALGSVGVDKDGVPTGPTIASGLGAFALGFGSVASGDGAFAVGVVDTAAGPFSLAMGYMTRSKGWFSTTMGWGTLVESAGTNGLATGFLTKAGNWFACSFGDETYASGHTSFATGYKSLASGHTSSAFGELTVSPSYCSMAIGRYNAYSGTADSWVNTDPVFMIGNGTSVTARSNAMTVYKNGNADLKGSLNLNNGTLSTGALYVDGAETIWYGNDGVDNYFSWGYGANYNVFAHPVSVGTTDTPSIYGLYVAGSIYATGGWAGSDSRWKKDLEPLKNLLPEIMTLQGFKYSWRKDEYPSMNFDSGRQIGVVAQDIEKVFPELVKTDDKGYKAVSYEKLSVILLEGIKEQQKQIKSQQEQIDRLEKIVGEIKAKLADM